MVLRSTQDSLTLQWATMYSWLLLSHGCVHRQPVTKQESRGLSTLDIAGAFHKRLERRKSLNLAGADKSVYSNLKEYRA